MLFSALPLLPPLPLTLEEESFLSLKWPEGFGASFGARAYFESAYCSSSGSMGYTKPVAEQTFYLTLRLGEFGRVSTDGWVCSALNGQKNEFHRRAFYIYEGTLMYGRDFTVLEGATLSTDAGILWDWLFGYDESQNTPFALYMRQSLKNPYITPFWNYLAVLKPSHSARARGGFERAFKPVEPVTVTFFIDVICSDRSRFANTFGDSPDNLFLEGCFMTGTAGFSVEWRFMEHWYAWGRFRQYVVIDNTARNLTENSSSETAVKDYPVFGLGVGCRF